MSEDKEPQPELLLAPECSGFRCSLHFAEPKEEHRLPGRKQSHDSRETKQRDKGSVNPEPLSWFLGPHNKQLEKQHPVICTHGLTQNL